ncbi:MAG: tRNA (adenosine(37)-N6)-threonylcarbamoyltransferase complex dimerization subunit type 1 TsaB [Synergistaceae bacterium]|jgi:tRNA threonylcarbamoyladenosine biosynthesis protein TsaB|nr:tRNA (adenosine(37)-N6)-threonylcarbamoyltransferase complex dimerization subunit type 1 TsaB [Synergistaceae bacterium]
MPAMKDVLLTVDCSLRWTLAGVCRATGAASGAGSESGSGENGRSWEVLASECLDLGRRQAAELPLLADRLLEKSGRTMEDVGLIAVTNGPGYFTGIRTGVSWASALAYGLGVRVVPVSSLLMLARAYVRESQREAPALVFVYAGQKRVYAASFGCAENLPTGEYDGEALEAWLNSRKKTSAPEPILLSDDPERACKAAGLDHPFLRPVLKVLPSADALAEISLSGKQAPLLPEEVRVFYHRAPQGCAGV